MGYKQKSNCKGQEYRYEGILLVNKPQGWTSHDVVNFVRIRFNIRKVGHCGTLDPRATGLLVLLLGKYTKLSSELSGDDKIYECRIILGLETDSYDMDGKVTAKKDYSHITKRMLEAVLEKFTGYQEQIPPMLSAIKKEGKPLYKLARKGVEIKRDPKPITIHSIKLKKFEPPYFDITVHCSKGTYIRTLAHDIGKELDCAAALDGLIRTHSGNFSLEHAVDMETLKKLGKEELGKYIAQILAKK